MARICIVGMGAVGSLLGFFSSRGSGELVHAIVRRSEHAEKLNVEGVKLEGLIKGGYRVKAGLEPPREGCDYTIIATKAYDAPKALEAVAPHSKVLAVACNGFGPLEAAASLSKQALGVIVDYGVTRLSDTRVEVRGLGSLTIGPPRGSTGEAMGHAETLARILELGGANVRVVDDIEPWRWLKAAVNAVINPITALARKPNSIILDEKLKPLVEGLTREAALTASKLGVAMPLDPLSYVYEVASRTRDNKSSMLADVEAGRRTEIEEINGYIVRVAESLGLEAPYNKTLYSLVKTL
ncbi:MAG: 2-dehydropantoate 2-reductase [Thermoprotei archaeon]|nr:2-dehydropantoate 2-reductase [Thermoprotei archaeon]